MSLWGNLLYRHDSHKYIQVQHPQPRHKINLTYLSPLIPVVIICLIFLHYIGLLKKNICWFAFVHVVSVFASQFNFASGTVPKYLNCCTIATGSCHRVQGRKRGMHSFGLRHTYFGVSPMILLLSRHFHLYIKQILQKRWEDTALRGPIRG